jgi:hypothetical protein
VPAIDAWFFWFGKWVERTVLLATTNAGRWRTLVVVVLGGVVMGGWGGRCSRIVWAFICVTFKVEFVVLFVDVADTTNTLLFREFFFLTTGHFDIDAK